MYHLHRIFLAWTRPLRFSFVVLATLASGALGFSALLAGLAAGGPWESVVAGMPGTASKPGGSSGRSTNMGCSSWSIPWNSPPPKCCAADFEPEESDKRLKPLEVLIVCEKPCTCGSFTIVVMTFFRKIFPAFSWKYLTADSASVSHVLTCCLAVISWFLINSLCLPAAAAQSSDSTEMSSVMSRCRLSTYVQPMTGCLRKSVITSLTNSAAPDLVHVRLTK
mmetsp:Transcript_25251/g.71198  ORF Transcript_25251/g.71198 Transcript_25251/m.71198 type:complete len:222 (+) Transcript_25251:703-1368(+)